MAAHESDLDRFNRWAASYEHHWMQRLIFGPVQRSVLELAESQVPRPAAILDVGCGTGRLLRAAVVRFPEARLEGVDASVEMVKEARAMLPPGSSITLQEATAEELPFPDRSFDLVFSTLTFHHWSDQQKGVRAISRVLTADGRWLLADFVASGPMLLVRRLFPNERLPERNALEEMLRRADLAVVAERRLMRFSGQLPVLAIARRDPRVPRAA